jgi:hypothetical protein
MPSSFLPSIANAIDLNAAQMWLKLPLEAGWLGHGSFGVGFLLRALNRWLILASERRKPSLSV